MLAVAFGSVACGSSESTPACRAGAPQAIFSPSDSSVVQHDFQSAGQSSIETTAFANGLLVALEQRGCDTLTQAFTLAHPRFSPVFDTFLIQGAEAFYAMAGVSPRVAGFAEYGRIVGGLSGKISEGAPAVLTPGFSVRIIRLPTPERVTWQVAFEQDFGVVGSPQ